MSAVATLRIAGGTVRPAPAAPARRTPRSDGRWPRIVATLDGLRLRHRRSVRIVDADCGCGTLLIEAARYARSIGFTAIEVRGIDGVPALIGRARVAALRHADPAIGYRFDCTDMVQALVEETAFPADILLCRTRRDAALLMAAGEVVIDDSATGRGA
jgi:2-polyprenyl-3-methyl-5-hydroxy-6-metoxy-1,4-benzoquinol methylase